MAEINLAKTPAQLFSKKLTHIKFSQLIVEDLNKAEAVNKKNLKENYLLNSYIINLVASWQVFIEDLAKYVTDDLIKNSQNSTVNMIIQNNFEEKIKKFNTPNVENINSLFKSIAGIKKIAEFLGENVRSQIDETLKIRHTIAHKGYSSVELSISGNFKRMEMLMEAAIRMEERVVNHIKIPQ